MEFHAPRTTLPNLTVIGFARTYFEAGKLLYEQRQGTGFYIPAGNLLCHAIELYMKALTNEAKWEPTEGGGYKEVTERSKSWHNLYDMLEKMDPHFRESLLAGRASLSEDLKDLDGLFQATRYPFEKSNKDKLGNVGTAFSVAEFLYLR
jgi:hypothetical protein